jgi:putative Holliday junction resolvase
LTSGPDNHAIHRQGSAIVLAFDFGARRIGIATGNAHTRTASPLQTLAAGGDTLPWDDIDRVVAEWRPEQLLVGMPGGHSSIVPRVRAFAAELGKRFGLPVATVDETRTSEAARVEIAAARRSGVQRRRSGKGDVDKLAACLIAEQWMSERESAGST